MRRQWLPWRNHLSGSSCVAVGICSRASAATATRHGLAMMPPGHGPSWESGSAGAVRERRQTKEMTRRAVDEKDVPMAVYGWLELSVCRSGNARSHVDCALRKYTVSNAIFVCSHSSTNWSEPHGAYRSKSCHSRTIDRWDIGHTTGCPGTTRCGPMIQLQWRHFYVHCEGQPTRATSGHLGRWRYRAHKLLCNLYSLQTNLLYTLRAQQSITDMHARARVC